MNTRKLPGRLLASTLFSGALALAAAPAQAVDFGVSLNTGLLGTGVAGTVGLTEKFNLRAGINSPWSVDDDIEESGVAYEAEITLGGGGFAMIDWHPWGSGFRISAGVVQNRNEISGTATLSEPVDIGGTTYQPSDIGSLGATIDFDSIAPYLGIGFGNAARGSGLLGFDFSLGLMLQGSPNADIDVTPGPALSPAEADQLQANAEQEESDLQDDLDEFDVAYPVLQLGLRITF